MYRRQKVKEAIRSKFHTFSEFSYYLNCDRSNITRWLNGERTPSYHTALKICRALDVTLEDIFGPEEPYEGRKSETIDL